MTGLTTTMAKRVLLILIAVQLVVHLCSSDSRALFSPDPPETVSTSPASEVQQLVDKVTDRLKCVQHGLQQLDCVQCLNTDRILKLLGIDGSANRLTSCNAQDLSFLFLHHILNFRTLCSARPPGCSDFSACQWQLMSRMRNSNILDTLENILRQVKQVLEPDASKTCFSAESILEEVNITSTSFTVTEADAKKLVTNLMGHIFEGHCINVGESVTDFLDDLFHVYGEKCSSVLSADGLKKIMGALQGNAAHDHGDHDHSHDHHQDKEDHTYCDHHHDHKHDHMHGHSDHDHHHSDHDHSDYGHNHAEHDHSDHDYSDHNHSDPGHDHSHYDHSLNHSHHDHDHDDDHDLSTQGQRMNISSPVAEEELSTTPFTEAPPTTIESPSPLNIANTSTLLLLRSSRVALKNESAGSHVQTTVQPLLTSAAESQSKSGLLLVEFDDYSEITPASSLKSDLSHQQKEASSLNKIHHHTEDLRRFYMKKFGGTLKKEDSTPTAMYTEAHEHTSLATKCLSMDELLSKFGHAPNNTVSKAQFLQLCPALVQQIVSGVCQEPIQPGKRPGNLELYGYSSLSVGLITLTSLAGVFLLPILTKSVYHYVMNGFIGLAFSTLAGDALLHLVPQALGIHSHDETSPHSHDHSGGVLESVEPYVWKQLGVLAAIYFLFLFEAITCIFSKDDEDEHGHGNKSHGHSHVPENLPKELTLVSVKSKSESSTQLAFSRQQSESSLDTEIAEIEEGEKPKPILNSRPVFLGLTSMALVVTLGDSFHNFGDGLAIGAAFSSGLRGGLSTSIAVFCHELPHEFGDFVILLSTGLSFHKALLINFLSGLTAFAGLYIGIQLGDNVVAREWIMAVTAGIFLYVALAEMLPELKEHHKGRPGPMLTVKNLGVLGGIGIMLIISIYEERFYI